MEAQKSLVGSYLDGCGGGFVEHESLFSLFKSNDFLLCSLNQSPESFRSYHKVVSFKLGKFVSSFTLNKTMFNDK